MAPPSAPNSPNPAKGKAKATDDYTNHAARSTDKRKGKRTSTALHTELSEYAALLKALKTQDLLDLTGRITRHAAPSSSQAYQNYLSSPGAGPSTPRTPTTPQKSLWNANASPSGSETTPQREAREKRDQWTRWPLPLADIYIPEWTLEDEVEVVVGQCVRIAKAKEKEKEGQEQVASPSPRTTGDPPIPREPQDYLNDSDFDDELDEYIKEPGRASPSSPPARDPSPTQEAGVLSPSPLPELPPSIPIDALSSLTSAFLKRVLTLIAYQTPLRAASMQNRINVIDWVAVMKSLCSMEWPTRDSEGHWALSEQMIENAKRRLEDIFGPAPSKNLFPSPSPNLRKDSPRTLPRGMDLASLLDEAEDDFFYAPPLNWDEVHEQVDDEDAKEDDGDQIQRAENATPEIQLEPSMTPEAEAEDIYVPPTKQKKKSKKKDGKSSKKREKSTGDDRQDGEGGNGDQEGSSTVHDDRGGRAKSKKRKRDDATPPDRTTPDDEAESPPVERSSPRDSDEEEDAEPPKRKRGRPKGTKKADLAVPKGKARGEKKKRNGEVKGGVDRNNRGRFV